MAKLGGGTEVIRCKQVTNNKMAIFSKKFPTVLIKFPYFVESFPK
jgi:hypothetical protein